MSEPRPPDPTAAAETTANDRSRTDTDDVVPTTPDAEDAETHDTPSRTRGGRRAKPPAAPRGRRGRVTGTLALLLALLAVGLGGTAWWQQERMARQLTELRGGDDLAREALEVTGSNRRRLEALRTDVDSLREQGETRRRAFTALEETLSSEISRLRETSDQEVTGLRDSLGRDVQRLREDVQQWPVRLADLEDSVASLRGVSDDARRRWLRAEAEYFLNIANTELALTADVERAVRALELADARLRQADEPALAPVRAEIARELTQLAAVPRVDRAGISLRLASLAEQVDDLPLPQPAPGVFAGDRPLSPDDAEPGLERALAALRQALSGMLSVRRDDAPLTPQLAPAEVFFLRRNLELQIENARLALLQRESALYQDHLRSAVRWLEAWFDPEDPTVAGVQRSLEELAGLDVAPSLPTADGALRRLREYARLREREG